MEKPLLEQQCSSLLGQISSHPLFSILTTFFLLNLLYLPNLLLIFFPVLITTSLILTTLLHFASPRRPFTPPPKDRPDPNPIQIQLENGPYELPAHVELHDQETWSNMFCNKGAPLEVIYEGEELDEGDSAPEYSGQSPEYSRMVMMISASTNAKRLDYFGYCTSSTESDADSDDDESSSEENNACFRWDEDEEGMIEIALEEDNLIEINLSACRKQVNTREEGSKYFQH